MFDCLIKKIYTKKNRAIEFDGLVDLMGLWLRHDGEAETGEVGVRRHQSSQRKSVRCFGVTHGL
jgi:hypothetical protein